ncbi:MAG: DUF488 domain-containing protein [Desulfomonilaceae bacterium]
MIRVKRIYDEPAADDGYRALVDRLWPRGVKKEKARIDIWLKEAAPSDELRKWFNHDPEKWNDFKERYFAELESKHSTLDPVIKQVEQGLTLVYSAKDEQYNNALALQEYLERQVQEAKKRK